MGRVGYSVGGGKGFKQVVFDDYAQSICVCGAMWENSSSGDDTAGFKAWEAIHRPHLEDKHGTQATAIARATAYAATLSGMDPRLTKGIVHIVHKDGSTFFLRGAFARPWKGFLLVFTLNHGYFAHDVDDLDAYRQLSEDMTASPALED